MGGVTLAIVSAIVMWVAESKVPNGKTIGRDVVLGIALFFLLLQLLPESTLMLVTALMSILTFRGASLTETVNSIVPSLDEMEVRVGVPKF